MRKIVRHCSYLIAAVLILVLASSSIADTEPDVNFDDVFKIIKSETNFTEGPNCKYITCLGEIQNLTNEVWESPTVEVKYFDSNGLLIDTETENLYSYILQANDTIPFRVRIQADRDASEYSSHSARVTWADRKINYSSQDSPKKKSSLITNILINWTPMLILIVVWVFFMWHLTRKRSPQAKSVELLKEQAILLERNNQLFERLVNAVESYTKK